jgi:hypothetical protein
MAGFRDGWNDGAAMKFAISREVRVPAAFAFEQASDFMSHEIRAAHAGFAVTMLTGLPLGQGSRWRVEGPVYGQVREVQVEVAEFDPPNQFVVKTRSGGIFLTSRFAFVGLTGKTCRIETETVAKPANLRARIMIHAARLIRPRITRRIRRALNKAASQLESHYRDQLPG